MTKQTKAKVQKICNESKVTITDIMELVGYYHELISKGEYEKAEAVEYGLEIIFNRTKDTHIKSAVMFGMIDISRIKNTKRIKKEVN